MLTCSALIVCRSFDEAVGITELYPFSHICFDWSYVRAGKPVFDLTNYDNYCSHNDFCFQLDANKLICDFGRYEAMRDRCPEELHLFAADILGVGDFQSDDLEVLLNA